MQCTDKFELVVHYDAKIFLMGYKIELFTVFYQALQFSSPCIQFVVFIQ